MSFLGRFLVEQGAITEAQLEDGLRFQAEQNRRIGEVAMERGLLTPTQVRGIRDLQQEDPRLFGDIAVGARQLTRAAVDELLFFQKVQHVYLGEALLVLGHIDREQYQRLMGRHYALRGACTVSLRYLQDFVAENNVVELLFEAFGRAVLRFCGEQVVVSGLGQPFDPSAFTAWLRLSGHVLDGRRLEARLGLSASLVGKLGRDRKEGTVGDGLAPFAETVLRYGIEMLRDAGLVFDGGRIESGKEGIVCGEDGLMLRCQTPTGEAAMVFILQESQR